MATIRNRIIDYKVGISLERVGTSPTVNRTVRIIDLTTEPLVHGITRQISMVFSNDFDTFNTPVVGRYWGLDTFSHHVTIWLPVREFQVHYDLLRHEKPVYYEFNYNASGDMNGYITQFTLTTGTEQPGEGDTDVSGLMSLVIPERIAVLSAMGIRTEPEVMTTNGQS